jgi:pentatricopeptide repeat protein
VTETEVTESQFAKDSQRALRAQKSQKPPRRTVAERNPELHEKYTQLDALLSQNKLVEASNLFKETYTPEAANMFRYFNEGQEAVSLSIRFFRSISSAYKKGKGEGLIPLTELFALYNAGKLRYGWMCSEVILHEVSKGNYKQGIEAWVNYYESFDNVKTVQKIENKEAACAALIAYIASCVQENTEIASKIALFLVPLKAVPDETEVLNLIRFSGFTFDKSLVASIVQGFKTLRLQALDPASLDFLNNLPIDRPNELENRYNDCKTISANTGKPLPESTYARFIFCFSESGRVQQAFDVWNDLLQTGVAPSVQTWNMLLKAAALSKGSSVAVTEGILAKMAEANVKPNSDSYGTLIDVYFKAGLPSTAIDIFEKIQKGLFENISTNLKIFNVMLNGLLNSGNDELARKLLMEGIDIGFSPNVVSFNTFIKTYIKQKKYDQVEKVLLLMDQYGVAPDIATYSNLLDNLYKSANAKKVDPSIHIEALLKDMNKNGIRSSTLTLTSLIDGLAKSGNPQAANDLFKLMRIKKIRPNIRTFTALINGEVLAGNLPQAVEYFKEMSAFGVPPVISTYNQIIHAFAERGSVNDCLKYFHLANDSKKVSVNRYTYTFVLQAIYNSRKFHLANEVLDVMKREKPNFVVGRPLQALLLKFQSRGITLPEFKFKVFEDLSPEAMQKTASRD